MKIRCPQVGALKGGGSPQLYCHDCSGTSPSSHHKGAIGRVRTGDKWYPVLCNCQLGQDIPYMDWEGLMTASPTSRRISLAGHIILTGNVQHQADRLTTH